jgi:magnesium transporter
MPDGSLSQIDADAVQPDWVSDDLNRWVNVTGRSPELEQQLRILQVPEPLLQECMSEPTRPAVLVAAEALVISVPMPAEDGELLYVTLLYLASTVLTISDRRSEYLHRRLHTLRDTSSGSMTSTASVLFGLLVNTMRDGIPEYFSLRTETNMLAKRIELERSSVDVEEIVSLKRQVLRLSDLFEDYRFCLAELSDAHTDLAVIDVIHHHIDGFITELDQAIAASARLKDRCRDIALQNQQFNEEATNRRLGVLTILSAVFLPSTLIAGIYGMNFEHMPALTLRHGYGLVLSVIFLLIFFQLFYFKYKKWF